MAIIIDRRSSFVEVPEVPSVPSLTGINEVLNFNIIPLENNSQVNIADIFNPSFSGIYEIYDNDNPTETYVKFNYDNNTETIALRDSNSNISLSDEVNKVCIFVESSNIVFKNRLGSSKSFKAIKVLGGSLSVTQGGSGLEKDFHILEPTDEIAFSDLFSSNEPGIIEIWDKNNLGTFGRVNWDGTNVFIRELSGIESVDTVDELSLVDVAGSIRLRNNKTSNAEIEFRRIT